MYEDISIPRKFGRSLLKYIVAVNEQMNLNDLMEFDLTAQHFDEMLSVKGIVEYLYFTFEGIDIICLIY